MSNANGLVHVLSSIDARADREVEAANLQQTVTEMMQSTHIENTEVMNAMQQMTLLFQNLTAIAAKSQAAAEASPHTAPSPSSHHDL